MANEPRLSTPVVAINLNRPVSDPSTMRREPSDVSAFTGLWSTSVGHSVLLRLLSGLHPILRTRISNSRQSHTVQPTGPPPAQPAPSRQRPPPARDQHENGDVRHPRHSSLGLKRSPDLGNTCNTTKCFSHTQFVIAQFCNTEAAQFPS